MRTRHRGFTLLELTIVIAVTAVMTVGIVTLCTTVKGISERTTAVQRALSDVSVIRREASRWLSYFDSPDWTVEIGDGGTPDDTEEGDKIANCLVATNVDDQTEIYKMSMIYGDDSCVFSARYPDSEQSFSVETRGLTLLHFERITADNVDVPAYSVDGNGDEKQTVSATLADDALVIKCSVSYFQNDSQGNIARQTVPFLIVARGRA